MHEFVNQILLGSGLFLAGIATRSVQKLAEKLEDIRVSLATIGQRLLQHENRIEKLEERRKN